jgi:hypothetical protein
MSGTLLQWSVYDTMCQSKKHGTLRGGEIHYGELAVEALAS